MSWSLTPKLGRYDPPKPAVEDDRLSEERMMEAMIAKGDKLFCIMRTGNYYLNWERAGAVKLEASVNGMPNISSAIVALYHKVKPYL